ncbi:MAG TPA: histidine kinase [Burkholderiaceae bacterium]|nr:histidine kinase [Burkholderiaceae bacterium]
MIPEQMASVVRAPSRQLASSRLRRLAYWGLQLLGWGLYFWAQASGEVIFAGVAWSKAGTLWGGVCFANIAFTDLLRRVAKRRAWFELRPGALSVRVLVGLLLVSLSSFLITTLLSQSVYGTPIAPILGSFYGKLSVRGQLINQFIGCLLLDVMWVALYFGFAMQRHRYRTELARVQLGKALQAAELRLLQAQLNPHFLFNSLNSLRGLIQDEPARAQETVTRLARTLRYTLQAADEHLVTLAHELEMVDDYLALEALRLAERLQIARDIEPNALRVRVPRMLVQSLVENAIKHGVALLRPGGTLGITARLAPGELVILVSNPRPMQVTPDAPAGVGLKNSAERLRLLFGSRAKLHLDLSIAGQATAEVRIPT